MLDERLKLYAPMRGGGKGNARCFPDLSGVGRREKIRDDANIDLHADAEKGNMSTPRVPGNVKHIIHMNVELIEKAAQVVGDHQLLVNIVSRRVQQLNNGSDPYIPTTPDMGCGDIALTEIIEGKLVWREVSQDEANEADRDDAFDFEAPEDAPAHAEEPELVTATVRL